MIVSHIRRNFADAFYPRLSEWFCAGVLFAIGCMLTVNDGLMSDAVARGMGRGYQLLLQIGDQSTWATVLVLFGTIRLIILLINGAWRKSPWGRAGSAFLSCFFWCTLVLSFAPTAGFGFIMACGWLGMDMVNVMRAMRDARIVDDAYKARGQGSGLGLE